MSPDSPASSNPPERQKIVRVSLRASCISPTLEPQFHQYRRRLPHWRLTSSTYFVTWRILERHGDLTHPECDLIVSVLRHFDEVRYDLFAWVVMNDHVHALLKPKEPYALENILHSWKSSTARQLQTEHGRVGKIWQEETFDRIVRDEVELREKVNYILENPRRRWPELDNYAWAGVNFRE